MMSDIDFMLPSDKEWLVQIADALDAAKRIYPNVIQMSDELARGIAGGLRRIAEDGPENPWAAGIARIEKSLRYFLLGERHSTRR